MSDPPAGESTSRSIKSKLPTLDLPWTALTLVCTGADIKLDQDKPAYPRPHTSHIIDRPALESILEPTMSKQPTLHRPAHSRTRSCQPDSTDSNKPNSTKSNSTTLHRPSGDDTSKNPQPLQVSRNPENPLGKSRRRTAYPQQIVTTRLLYCLQYPVAHLSRIQRIYPHA